ncbi:C1 family peptidase [Ideonella alba]|uniref:C1 family peptidase n=1 Tax=Ideonella alba TaxID=2824118 RepID=A0A941BGR3_9BURK|nr:C1 family peptidase [Ideonella alba]MBQ0930813.1 C1 family peptidase [Ideonella alba]
MPTKNVQIGQRAVSLDARPDRLDLRDRAYLPPLGNLPMQWPGDADVRELLPRYAPMILDQGEEGACTGFGLAAAINYQLFIRGLGGHGPSPRQVSPAMLYQLARLYDEWPGEDYEGSSCRGALKGWHRHGVCRADLWPHGTDPQGRRLSPQEDPKRADDPERNWDVDALACTLGVYYRVDVRSVVDLQAALSENGVVYVSATVHEGWAVPSRKTLTSHADLVRIRTVARPKDAGGHAFALVGYNTDGFVVQNSWGADWGSHGFALLPYEDWVLHASDAWVFTLGVPRLASAPAAAPARRGARSKPAAGTAPARRAPRFLVPTGTGATAAANERPAGLVGADDALMRRYQGLRNRAHQPLDADQAYRHTLVLDRGFPVRNDITADSAASALQTAVLTRPLAWLKAQGSVKLMVYAHGGLNSEADSITRIRVMAPYALANGIYPLFISWRSGPMETISDLVEEQMARFGLGSRGGAPARGWLDRLSETTDRMLEPALRGPGGAMWGQMKLNAERASNDAQGGVRLMVAQLQALKAQIPKLEIHLLGHSAGSIVLGAMLDRLHEAGLKAASLRLFAPACTLRFALDHYRPAVQRGTLAADRLAIHALSDANELNDSVGPYRKSLLYLVSRAFEDVHKMPILGMAKAFDPGSLAADLWSQDRRQEVLDWQAFWSSLGQGQPQVLSKPSVSNGVKGIAASHGCFDNAVDIYAQALGAIVSPQAPVAVKVERLDY